MGACVPSFIRFEMNLNKNTSHENKYTRLESKREKRDRLLLKR